MPKDHFQFKQFTIRQDRCLMKVGTDGVLLGAWADVRGARTILDIGAGTGLIALMLAQRAPEALIDAVELDPGSAEQAAENIAASPWSGRVRVFSLPIQDFAPPEGRLYDLIVSNPPFFAGALKSPKPGRNQVRHGETLSFSALLLSAGRLLSPQGRFSLILPYAEAKTFQELAVHYHLFTSRVCEVHSRFGKPVERVLMELGRTPAPLVREPALCLQGDGAGGRSGDYGALTEGFYL
jgi:tRNA1Val (adenine37-N6)-methyltransferase